MTDPNVPGAQPDPYSPHPQPYGQYGHPQPVPQQIPGLPPGVVVPSLGDRFLGRLIDVAVLLPAWIVLMIVGGAAGSIVVSLLFLVLVYGAVFAYHTWMIADRGQTIGKKAMGMRVVMIDNGQRPDQASAAKRAALYEFSGLACCVGGLLVALSPLFDGERRQGWPDKVAKTIVIKG